jgi:predicted ArsR family transcriptional regulator
VRDAETRGARQVLDVMKVVGPQTAEELAGRLSMSPVGMRLHLNELARRGLVRFEERRGRVGRPLRVWSLSDAADVRFPDGHAGLAVDLLTGIKDIFGKQALRRLIVQREKEMLARYRAVVGRSKTLAKRVGELAALRTQEGYMAEARTTAQGVLLVENHCPICAAAKECQQFCCSELRVFQQALGEDVTVERVDHILAGARRCAYLVCPRKPVARSARQRQGA